MSLLPLDMLTVGQFARIDVITGQPDHVHRLGELGLRGGAHVEMLQTGSPCIIRVSGHKLCFRADDQVTILVQPERGS